MLEFVYALSPNKPFVHFEVILDKDGNPEMSYIGMNYGERGKIGYTQAALINEYKDELLFHEFFHVFQYAGKEPALNRSDELEAYLAQYFYASSREDSAWVIDKKFTERIMELASYIDVSTGYLRKGVDYEEFYNVYTSALDYLDGHPNYSGDGWTSGRVEAGLYPFQKLAKLLNQNL